jgi:hypothetical protein
MNNHIGLEQDTGDLAPGAGRLESLLVSHFHLVQLSTTRLKVDLIERDKVRLFGDLPPKPTKEENG